MTFEAAWYAHLEIHPVCALHIYRRNHRHEIPLSRRVRHHHVCIRLARAESDMMIESDRPSLNFFAHSIVGIVTKKVSSRGPPSHLAARAADQAKPAAVSTGRFVASCVRSQPLTSVAQAINKPRSTAAGKCMLTPKLICCRIFRPYRRIIFAIFEKWKERK